MNPQTTNARRTDPLSSHAAGYKFANSEKLEKHQDAILYLLSDGEKLTSREMADKDKKLRGSQCLDRHQVARRLKGMKEKGLIDCTPKSIKGERQWWAVKSTN